jgi:hypothetical protein
MKSSRPEGKRPMAGKPKRGTNDGPSHAGALDAPSKIVASRTGPEREVPPSSL